MICPACRERKHGDCPELARQKALDGITALGSQWCECQHLGADLRPSSTLRPASLSDDGDRA